MSMRVSQDAISNSALSQAGGAGAAAAVGKARRNPSAAAGRARRDSVNLSSLSAKIAEAGRQSDAERAGRVDRLAESNAAGKYRVDAQKVSRAMIDEAIGDGYKPVG